MNEMNGENHLEKLSPDADRIRVIYLLLNIKVNVFFLSQFSFNVSSRNTYFVSIIMAISHKVLLCTVLNIETVNVWLYDSKAKM